ncbi:hypothetical protein ACWIDS_16390 [Dietzia maris]
MTSPKPTAKPGHRTWVVKSANGAGEIAFSADYFRTHERRDGLELAFYNRGAEHDRRVGTVRPGSWHWVGEETALVEEAGDE